MKASVFGVSAMALAVLSACGKAETPPAAAKAAAQDAPNTEPAASGSVVKDVSEAMGDMMKAIGGGTPTAAAGQHEPIDFHALSALLPQRLDGYENGEPFAERNTGFGIVVAEVRQSFHTPDNKKQVRFEIIDPGTLSGPVSMAHAWMSVDIDRQSSEGYEKTSTLNGRKLHEQWQSAARKGKVTVVVGERFIVEVAATGVEMAELKTLLDKIDLKKLESMKNAGKKS